MRIGIDGGTWSNRRGYGRFTRELVSALAQAGTRHSFALFLDPMTARDDVPPGVTVMTLPVRETPSRAASAAGFRTPRDLWAAGRAMTAAPLDALFFPSVYTFVPILRRVPLVVCIHDVIPERHPDLVFPARRARWFWNLKVRLAIRQAHRILTVSEHARRGIAERLRVPPGRIRVTNEAPAASFRPAADPESIAGAFRAVGLPPDVRVLAYLGGIAPHKNLAMLISAFTRLVREPGWHDLHLLLIGDYEADVFHSSYPAVREQAAAVRPDRIRFAGRLDDELVARLLSGVHAFVLPSLDEGFGLPGIEAAACGAPVVATRSSALPELLGDAGIYFDPTNEDDLVEALKRVPGSGDSRARMRASGIERAGRLSWEESAATVARVFDELEREGARP